MNTCGQETIVGLYHDKELTGQQSRDLERHLETCIACTERLAQMRRMSRLFSSIVLEPISASEEFHIHRAVKLAEQSGMDRAVIRIAIPLAALAASVLMVTSIWLADIMRGGVAAGATNQQLVSAAPQRQSTAELGSIGLDRANANLPDWMVRSLGGETP
jgi:anti-sigma factor RsiW